MNFSLLCRTSVDWCYIMFSVTLKYCLDEDIVPPGATEIAPNTFPLWNREIVLLPVLTLDGWKILNTLIPVNIFS